MTGGSGTTPGLGLGCLLVVLASLAEAQQQGTFIEYGFGATATAVIDGPAGVVAGPRLAIRTVRNTRGAVSLGVGVRDGEATGRGSISVEYLFAPRAVGRLGLYVGGGLAGVVGNGGGGFLLAYVGAERSPGRSRGWAIEVGVGGGFLVRLAYRWRNLPAGWRTGG